MIAEAGTNPKTSDNTENWFQYFPRGKFVPSPNLQFFFFFRFQNSMSVLPELKIRLIILA
jgi:hypothetical protein